MSFRRIAHSDMQLSILKARVWILLVCLVSIPVGSRCLADVFYLQSGAIVQGELLNPNRQPGDALEIETRYGVRMFVEASEVLRTDSPTALEESYAAGLPGKPDTEEIHDLLVTNFSAKGLTIHANAHRERLLDFDPSRPTERRALGYIQDNNRWILAERYWARRGMVLHKGKYKLPQDILIADSQQQEVESVAAINREIRLAVKEVEREGKNYEEKLEYLQTLAEPLAVPDIAERLEKARESNPNSNFQWRQLFVQILARGKSYPAADALLKSAVFDPSPAIRDLSIAELKSFDAEYVMRQALRAIQLPEPRKDSPLVVDRYAIVLDAVGDDRIVRPLLDLLVTVHGTLVQNSGSSTTAQRDGSIGMGQGGKPRIVTRNEEHAEVLTAVLNRVRGVNFNYDEEAWGRWYADSTAHVGLELRRDP